eukprot:scaffold32535_cov112-Isochrysis_galbana.AAC.1
MDTPPAAASGRPAPGHKMHCGCARHGGARPHPRRSRSAALTAMGLAARPAPPTSRLRPQQLAARPPHTLRGRVALPV